MRSNLMTAVTLVMMGLALQTAYGQITGREPPCGCYCAYPNYESFDETPCTSRLREDACEDGMKALPPEKFQSICRRMQAKLKSKADTNPCKKLYAKICPAACDDVSCYCGYGPDKGFTYTPRTAYGRSGPSKTAPTVATLSSGGRFLYRSTTRAADGETWFEIAPPGMSGGTAWVPGSELSCRRPVPPPVQRPSKVVDSGVGVARSASAQTAGSRG
jgi:hypothetical protein